MNTLITELMIEAGKTIPGDKHIDADFCKKFSELLIRDCYSVIIKSQRGHFNPATSWDAVKQHFGIEE